MEDFILNGFDFGSNQDWAQVACLFLAFLRVYMEIIGLDLTKLPVTHWVFNGNLEMARSFHKKGLYFSLGYILFYSPVVLFS